MIVQASASSPTENYAILGDDVVVPSDISEKYFETMKALGVEVSLAKSIVSNKYIEFAKKITTSSGEDYSILGPGQLLTVVRNRSVYGLALADAYSKGLMLESETRQRLSLALSDPDEHFLERDLVVKKKKRALEFGTYMLFGPKGLILRGTGGRTEKWDDLSLPMDRSHLDAFLCCFVIAIQKIALAKHRKLIRDSREALYGLPKTMFWLNGSEPLFRVIFENLLL